MKIKDLKVGSTYLSASTGVYQVTALRDGVAHALKIGILGEDYEKPRAVVVDPAVLVHELIHHETERRNREAAEAAQRRRCELERQSQLERLRRLRELWPGSSLPRGLHHLQHDPDDRGHDGFVTLDTEDLLEVIEKMRALDRALRVAVEDPAIVLDPQAERQAREALVPRWD